MQAAWQRWLVGAAIALSTVAAGDEVVRSISTIVMRTPAATAPAIPERQIYPIDLPTALRLADAQNPQVALARERVRQAYAQQQAAGVLWLPTLRAGVSFAQHDGTLQETPGRVIETNRNSVLVGSGAAAFGAGPPMIPGLSADFHVADAIFQPLAARRLTRAQQAASVAATNDLLLEVARGYLELQRAAAEVAIANEAAQHTRELRRLTDTYAKSGAGLQADADRSLAEESLRDNDVARAGEQVAVASARLVRLLHLDPSLLLTPAEGSLVPLDLARGDAAADELIRAALSRRPELIENDGAMGAAAARQQRERFAPLVPTVSVGVSYGGFGGSGGGSPYRFSDRTDFQAVAYWQVRNLGFGDRAAQRNRESELRQERLRRQALIDLVCQEVTETHAQVQFRRAQIGTAERGVAAASASYQRNFDRIKGAQGLPIEVLQSIQALLQAQRDYARSVTDFNLAQFALQRATGILLLDQP